LLIDALNLVRRVYAAQPGEDGPERAEGARLSSSQSLRRALRQCQPTHVVAIFDGQPPTWRHLLDSDYKKGRKPMPEALGEALPAYREAFAALGVPSLELPGFEADDVIATLATKISLAGGYALVLSTDKIFLQLLGDRISVRDHFGQRDLDRAWMFNRFGVRPGQFVDFLSLTGDSTNGITGVRGVGPKTAAGLIGDYSTLDAILAAAAMGETLSPAVEARLVAHEKDARLAQELVRLRTDLNLGVNLRSLRYQVAPESRK
jgi:protein Xni